MRDLLPFVQFTSKETPGKTRHEEASEGKVEFLCGLRRLTTLGDNSCYDKFGDNHSKIPGKGTNEKLDKIYRQIMYQRTEVCPRGASEKRKTFADSIWTLCDGVVELCINTKLNVCQ